MLAILVVQQSHIHARALQCPLTGCVLTMVCMMCRCAPGIKDLIYSVLYPVLRLCFAILVQAFTILVQGSYKSYQTVSFMYGSKN